MYIMHISYNKGKQAYRLNRLINYLNLLVGYNSGPQIGKAE